MQGLCIHSMYTCYHSCVHNYIGSEVHPQYVEPPVIPGHEFIGEVVKLGPGEFTCMHERESIELLKSFKKVT